jgi:hypothetical protein
MLATLDQNENPFLVNTAVPTANMLPTSDQATSVSLPSDKGPDDLTVYDTEDAGVYSMEDHSLCTFICPSSPLADVPRT